MILFFGDPDPPPSIPEPPPVDVRVDAEALAKDRRKRESLRVGRGRLVINPPVNTGPTVRQPARTGTGISIPQS